MPTEPTPISLFDVVRRAVAACDPSAAHEPLAGFLGEFEDRDEPVTAVADVEDELMSAARRQDPTDSDPAVAMAVAVATYLAFKRGELSDDDEQLLRLAARSEFDGSPPAHVEDWLRDRGVEP